MKVLFALLWYKFGFVGAAIAIIIVIAIAANSDAVKDALDGIDGVAIAFIVAAILAAGAFLFFATR